MSTVENSLTIDSTHGVASVSRPARSAGLSPVGSGSTDVGSARFQRQDAVRAASSPVSPRTLGGVSALLSGASAFLAQTLGQSNPLPASAQSASVSYARAAGLSAKDGDGIGAQAAPRRGGRLSLYG